MASDPDRSRPGVKQLLENAGNGSCADCGAADPEWASYTLGVFVCHSCSGLHRNIAHISKVKSLLLDPWSCSELEIPECLQRNTTFSHLEFMDSVGNAAAKARYEQLVPAFYCRPSPSDCMLLRDQWIRAKYERKEFMYVERQEPYSAGYREGFLWKRGRDNGQYLSRKFILSEREGVLKYFNKNDAREPKATMKISSLNATFQPGKMGTAHGLQITYLKDNSTRNIFVYHEDGKEMVDWFNAIRAARFHFLQVAFPGAPESEDAYARGEVFIGSQENRYSVLAGLPPNTQGSHWPFGITIATPDRKFVFACETEEDQRGWMSAFQMVVSRPMLPQDFAVEAYFKHKP
ncbi:arf-GAP with dual PH domain-containing protein 1 isoform X3 [Amphiprion ocellaris]|uniref:arf-GAP with dual PH domain-containing protein 1 isoform X3 n=1 Tax=Amphiprion ocellaris TaxID=80972 RepID=UPI00241110AD|nr:arf-GAP with dual PH domain-containing protein 1 isoform X3 [Amphiprion ocellaris]